MNGLRRRLAALAAGARLVLPDAAGIVGAGAVTYGAWQIYAPAGSIAGGAFLITSAILLARAAGR